MTVPRIRGPGQAGLPSTECAPRYPARVNVSAPTLVTMAIALITITNPIGSIPVFLDLTASRPAAEQRRIAVLAGIGVFAVLVVALFAGTFVLDAFDIDMTSFKIAGFAFVALIAWGMLTRSGSPVTSTGGSPAIVPLAFPVLAGPGAVALMISYAHDFAGSIPGYLAGVAIILVNAIIAAVAFVLAPYIARALGADGMAVFTKIFGLLLLAICVQAITTALIAAFPVLGGTGG